MLETRAVTQAPANVATQQAEIIQPIFGMRRLPTFLANPDADGRAPGAAYLPDHQHASRTPETPAEGATVTANIPAQTFAADLLKPQAAQSADRIQS